MKKINLLFWIFLLCATGTQAQVKKNAAKPAGGTAKKATGTTATAGINASNYGKVVDYLNSTIDCMNDQSRAISDRRARLHEMSAIYVTRDSRDILGNKMEHFAPYEFRFNYASEHAGTSCTDTRPPALMGAADVQFYTTSYQALRDTFIAITKIWNDVAAAVDKNGWSNYSPNEGKFRCENLQATIDHYYTIRKTLSHRTKEIQKILFPYSVAKSPDKKQYINMHDDLLAIEDFAETFDSYEDLQKNKASISTALNAIENETIRHSAELPNNALDFNYKAFYSDVNNYINQIKKLLNGTIRERDLNDQMEKADYHFGGIISTYNSIMSN